MATKFFKKAMRMRWDYWRLHTMQSHGSDHQSSGCTSKAIKVRPGEQGSVLSQ